MTPDKLREAQEAMRIASETPSKPKKKRPRKARRKSLHRAIPIVSKRGKHPNSLKAIAATAWKKGQSGNPSGLPGYDVAAEIARRAFEQFREEAILGLGKQLKHGNAYVYKEMADRAYGKLKEKLELSGADEIATQLEAARKRSKGK